MSRLRIALAADHGGFELKERLKEHLSAAGHDVADLGTSGKEPVDYPVFARATALRLAQGEADFGVVVDGAGIGSAMAANKVPGVLAATCNTEALARNAREHNDARLLALGAGHVDEAAAKRIVDVFLSTACTAERHLKRVAMIRDMEKERGMAELSAEDIERIAAKVKEMLGKGGAAPSAAPALTPEQVAKLIDHTLLKPDAMASDVEKLCAEARQHGFFSVCVNPVFVPQVKKLLQGSPVKVCCVVGFPLGAQDPQIKLLEARKAIREGAQEVDMVVNVGALKGKDDALVLRDIRGVVEACKDGRALSKVILETALLTDEEKVRACEL